ncbi:hypothetical protein Ahy_A01g000985 isoform J [Arachis hypogaea]|uniref:Uncharacterized protein n=1 Tax=Arachis hypogaea TaxID=3818 RepID=A0A445ELR4_ARAHY|nr:hypothetical protein Ahy_A01g000985 isoform J [Arachis hypogaea]
MATSPIVENPAKRRNVPAAPSAWMSDKNVKLTMRLAHQFETAAMPPPIPLNLNGDIRGIKISLTCSVSTEAEGVNVVNWRSGGSCLIENSGESEEANDDCNKG